MEMLVLNIKEPGNRRETQKCIVNTAMGLFSADWCAMSTLNPITQRFHGSCVATDRLRDGDDSAVQSWLESIGSEAIKHAGRDDTEFSEPPASLLGEFNLRDTSAVRTVILRTQREREPLAILYLGFGQKRLLAPDEEDSLSRLIAQSSLLLESAWLLGRYRSVISIGQELNKVSGPRDLFELLRREVASILNTSYFFMLAVYQPQKHVLDRYFSVERGKTVVQVEMELDGACETVIKKGQALKSFHLSTDVNWDVKHVDLVGDESPNPESVIFEPLIFRGEVLGVLTVQHPQAHAFDKEDVRIVRLLGNQVSLALSNLRLFQDVKRLNEIGQRLTQNLSSEELLNEVTAEVMKATGADIVTLYPYLLTDFGEPVYSGKLLAPELLQPTVRTDNIAWMMLKNGQPIWATDSAELYARLGGDPAKREGNFETREGINSTAAIALQIGNEPIGVMFVNFRTEQHFRNAQKNLILGLANYAAIAIKNYRKYTAANQRRFNDLETLQKIDRQMRQTPRLKEIMHAILDGAVSRIPRANESAILLYNPRTQQLETAASIGNTTKLYENLALPVNDGKGITVWVYQNKTAKVVNNVKTDPEFREIYFPVISDTLSEMDFPLQNEDEVVGVITFESRIEGAFTKEDEEFIRTLAGQAVLAIRNAQIYEMAEMARQELETLHDVAQQITLLGSDPEEVMKFILKKARVLLGAEMSALQLYEGTLPGKVYLSEEDAEDGSPIIKTIEPRGTDLQVKLGIVQHVAETRAPYITEGDAADDPYYEGGPEYHSEVAVPLISRKKELIGVLDLESPRLYAFDRGALKVLETFARQAVIAIQYAQFYTQARRESARFKLLSEAGRDLGELTEIEQVAQAHDIILEKVLKFSGGEVILRSFDEATEDLVLEKVLNPRQTPPQTRISKNEGVNGQVSRERRTIVIHDISNIPEGIAKPIGDDKNIHTLAVTPIQFKSRYYGNLVLSHEKAYSLSDADILLLEGLAQQLAITIYRLEIVQGKMEADQKTKELELVSELGQSTLEIAHRLGNDLGLVRFYISNIRAALSNSSIEVPVIDSELDKVLRDVGSVLNMSKGLKQKVSEIGEEGQGQGRAIVPVKVLLDDSSWSLPLPNNIQLTWHLANDLGEVNVIAGQIVDILRNLVANAMEAMPDGGKITIRAYNESPSIQVEIEDTGPGIHPDYQAKIFNLFFSTKSSSGFGLWSARRYARANGGDLTLKSVQGEGATFILTLPMFERTEGMSEKLNQD
jgi:GAF domain-containing protein